LRAWLVLLAVCVVLMLAAAALDLSAEPAALTPPQEEVGADPVAAPAPPQALRAELRRERLRAERMLRRLRAINRRLVRAYLNGPGYVSPNAGAWECIHRHEGAWDDPSAPYWGGLQFDLEFMRAYGGEFLARWGTADHWPPWAQILTADRAHVVRGFTPWPQTARACGVL